MSELTRGSIVRSLAGHDQGRFFLVLSADEQFAWIADGKERKLEAPKKKNRKHLAPTGAQLSVDGIASNKALRRLLSPYNFGERV